MRQQALAGDVRSRRREAAGHVRESRSPTGTPTARAARGRAQANAETSLDDFIARSERERQLRASTTAEYRRIANRLCEQPWRGELSWNDRPLGTFTGEDLIAVRSELVDAGRNASTVNHCRRIVRAPSEPT
ncbi:MAG: hypothetical protein WCD11_21520 [Solirubrobacteraceae bacterium]